MLFLAFLVAPIAVNAITLSKGESCELRKLNILPQDRAKADPAIGLQLPKFIRRCSIGAPTSTKYTLKGKLLSVRWEDGFPMCTSAGQNIMDCLMVVGVKNAFTNQCVIRTFLQSRLAPGEPSPPPVAPNTERAPIDHTRHINVQASAPWINTMFQWHEEFDSIHIMYHQRGQNNWLITGDVLKQALPYWDVNAMLIPALLYGVACLLLVILVVMLIIENHREPEYYNENPYPIDEDRYLDEEYYYAEDPRHDDDVRVPIPSHQKVVRRIKAGAGARDRLSTNVHPRVRKVSIASISQDPGAEEPQLNYDGELDQVMLMV